MEDKLNKYGESLNSFLNNKCVGDWANCVECPESYHIDGACTHPEHPSMQPVKTEFKQELTISKVFHDIRNTYGAFMHHFDDVNMQGFKVDPEEALKMISKDLALMAELEQDLRGKEDNHGQQS